MASFKVTYGQTSRKVNIASNITWTEFESQLHDLFNIPNETAISVSYIDEDGDVVTLSTSSELQQILSDQELFGANVKFNISTSENPDNNNGWVLENAEEKDENVTTLSEEEETSLNKDDDVVAYTINETEKTEVAEQQQQQQQPTVNYPKVTVTEEKDDPLFEPTVLKENNSQLEELLTPVSEEKEKNQETESSTNTEKSSSDKKASQESPDEKEEKEEESENDPNFIFIVSSSPWIQRTYCRPRINLFNSPLSGYPTYFDHFARPRYSYITPNYGFRRHPYFGSRGCRFISNRDFGGFSGFGSLFI